MLKFLFRNRSWPIALDIGAGGIRTLQLRTVGGRQTAVASARWLFPHQIAATEACNPDRVSMAVEAVKEMLRTNPFRGRRVVSSLPTGRLHIKNVRLPHTSDDQLREAVLAEARERFSFEVKPDQLSYLNAGPVRQGTETRDEIIMMAAPPETIDQHMDMLDRMGLQAEHIDAEPIAMFRGFERFLRRATDETAVSVVVDIGMSGTRVVIARGRQIVFIKNIDIGGRRFTEAVAGQLNLSFDEASDLRIRMIQERQGPAPADPECRGPAAASAGGNTVNWTIYDALRAEVEALAREVALCLRYCAVTFRGLRAQRVTVVGGEAYDGAVLQILSDHLGVPCTVGQPLRGVDTSEVDLGADRRGTLTEWAVCSGLAIRSIDAKLFQALPAEQEAERMTA